MCVLARLSWQGIEYLAALERLNVYRNRISSLAEVFRLRSLTELTEVDFGLNPVVESKPDYRLSVVHTLPRLRQLGRPAAALASLGAARWVSRVLGVMALLTLLEREADCLFSQESCLEGGREPLPCGHRWLLGQGRRHGLALLSSWCPVSWHGLLGVVSGSAGQLGSTWCYVHLGGHGREVRCATPSPGDRHEGARSCRQAQPPPWLSGP